MSDWCYRTSGDHWTECDTATTREEAIVEATEYAKAGDLAAPDSVTIGRKHSYAHADFVGGSVINVFATKELAEEDAAEVRAEYPERWEGESPRWYQPWGRIKRLEIDTRDVRDDAQVICSNETNFGVKCTLPAGHRELCTSSPQARSDS